MNSAIRVIEDDTEPVGWYNNREAVPHLLPPRVVEWRTWQHGQALSTRTIDERLGVVLRCAMWAGSDPEERWQTRLAALRMGDYVR